MPVSRTFPAVNRPFLWRRLPAVLLLWLFYCAPGMASSALLTSPEIRVLPGFPENTDSYSEAVRDGCCEDLKPLRSGTLPRKRASVSLKTLYSAQAGSWMFESLVHNGLFKVASGYQPSHPRAVMIEDGAITLKQLVAELNNPRILARTQENDIPERAGYTLHYPVIIGPSATLFIENTALALDSDSGTALINLGRLIIRDSRLAPVSPDARGGKHFRPFILAWNASDTAVIDSQLYRLGYNAFLSQGLTVAHHPDLDHDTRARLLLSGSELTWLESGLITTNAGVLATNNRIDQVQRYGIDASGGELNAAGNTISNIRYNNGIRASDTPWIHIKGNRIAGTQKAGILISGTLEKTVIVGNYIENSGSDGLALRDIMPAAGQSLDIRGNALIGNAKSGLRLSNMPSARVINNSLMANGEYGINIDDSIVANDQASSEQAPILIAGNQLTANRVASIKTMQGGRMMLGQNQFQMSSTFQSVFAGDLVSLQTTLLNHLIINKKVVEIIP